MTANRLLSGGGHQNLMLSRIFDMTRLIFKRSSVVLLVAAFALAAGCGEDGGPGSAMDPPPNGPGPDGGGGRSPGIKRIMVKLAKGPQSLTPVIGNELNADPIPWEALQTQTKEYSQSAAELAQYDPPKGAQESWTKLCGAFADSAAELAKAAAARNKETALVAHDQLKNSCNACHQEHRRMGRGGGGGPPGFGPGPRGGPGAPPPGPGGASPPPGGPA